MTDSAPKAKHRSRRGRLVPLAWISGVAAAAVLILGVNGTLSSWSAALVTNNNNTAITTNAVVLQEQVTGATAVDPTCLSSTSGFINTATACTINKYGGVATPLTPGGASVGSSVTFTNVGSENGSSFKLAPLACTSTPTTGNTTTVNLCTSADLTLTMRCYAGATVTGTAFSDLTYSGTLGNFAAASTLTHTTGMAENGSVTCTFALALSGAANPQDGGITVSQPLKWELDGA